MEKSLFVIIDIFCLNQNIHIQENGKIVDTEHLSLQNLSSFVDGIVRIANEHNCKKVIFHGNKKYTQKIVPLVEKHQLEVSIN